MNIKQANEVIWYGKPVLYDGTKYKLTAVIKRKHHKNSAWYYQAELQDLNAENTVVIVGLERIELI